MAKELEGREVTVIPSQVGKVTPMDTPEQEWTWAIEGLKEVYSAVNVFEFPITAVSYAALLFALATTAANITPLAFP